MRKDVGGTLEFAWSLEDCLKNVKKVLVYGIGGDGAARQIDEALESA